MERGWAPLGKVDSNRFVVHGLSRDTVLSMLDLVAGKLGIGPGDFAEDDSRDWESHTMVVRCRGMKERGEAIEAINRSGQARAHPSEGSAAHDRR